MEIPVLDRRIASDFCARNNWSLPAQPRDLDSTRHGIHPCPHRDRKPLSGFVHPKIPLPFRYPYFVKDYYFLLSVDPDASVAQIDAVPVLDADTTPMRVSPQALEPMRERNEAWRVLSDATNER